jgi:peptidoglycan/LPS O-acetylase OafA/YrhL
MQERIKLTPAQMGVVDGVRALAVLAVVALHWKNVLAGPGGIVALVTTPGAGGVIIFFVVSGLCITLSKKPEESWWNFYLRRLFRIVPACWGMLGGYLAVLYWGWGKTITLPEAFTSFALLPNWFGSATVADWPKPAAELNPVLWSLQTELELYALFPLTLLLFRRIGPGAFLVTTFAVTVGAWALWLWTRTDFSYFPPLPSICHWAIWGLGLYLCSVPPRGRPAGRGTLALALAALGLGAALLLLRNGHRANVFSFWYFLTGLGTFWFLRWALAAQPQWLRHRWLVEVGKRSYSYYLWHWPVAIVATLFIEPRIEAGLLALVALLVIAEISYRLIELPFIRLGKSVANLLDARRKPALAPSLAIPVK